MCIFDYIYIQSLFTNTWGSVLMVLAALLVNDVTLDLCATVMTWH